MYLISDIDTKIPFSKRHPNETIREILRYDSGYLKDLFYKDEDIVFTRECLADICRLTAKHEDNWETPPAKSGLSAFSRLKTYGTPYLYNFNDEDIAMLNSLRLEELG
ncbi:hypothetical protein EEL50_03460 [Muribaculaceae bacterium Isolate-105 (HZI)]|jgi:hypothetical protein|uniref:hypothetical protein n=1 Tax=Muribaculaceae TaxID=2005473 RepID=UPI000F474C8C|nr:MULTISPECIES: hypothetical protein [Muribaculaceae]ROT16286.1 hypothetical protein EEL50_03460 [Muribaculaceae bacterium Isolate-105 (HZI)]ROT20140.1 hypothetical protein EEL53_09205 [Muribaculaceae bacterium Isolate-114 (HZI)]